MLENYDSNLQTSAYHFKYFQNNPILKSRNRTNPFIAPDLPTLKVYHTPGKVAGSKIFAKMRGKDELKGTWNNFIPWQGVF